MVEIHQRLVVTPQLARRREIRVIPKSVAAVAPAYLRPGNTARLVQAATQPVPQSRVVAQPQHTKELPKTRGAAAAMQAVVRRPRSLVVPAKQPGRKIIKYITADATSLDVERLGNIRGLGRGRLLVIIGNGPSISEIPLERLKDHNLIDLMSINRPDERVWPTRYWSFFDVSQATRHKELWVKYDGVIFNSTNIKGRRPNTIQMKNLGSSGFSRNMQTGFHIGQSSVYVAMQIAMWLGYEHTYILGIDMCEVGGKLHYYGTNPDVAPHDRKRRFTREAEYYDEAAKILSDEERARYSFCSSYNPYGFVDKFRRLDHSVAIFEILDHAHRLAALKGGQDNGG